MKRVRPSGSSDEPMYTAAEIAALTKSSVRSVRRWIASGELQAVRPNRSVRIERSAFEAFLRRKRRKRRSSTD